MILDTVGRLCTEFWEKESKSAFSVPERENLIIEDIKANKEKDKTGRQQSGGAILWNCDFCKGSSRGLDPGPSREGLEGSPTCFASGIWRKKLMTYIFLIKMISIH